MENEVKILAESSYLPPSQLIEMFWWGSASLLIISIGISVLVSVSKESIRAFKKPNEKVEKIYLRALGMLAGGLILSFSSFFPFDTLPLTINVLLGIISGAHSELVYRWFLKFAESWIKKKVKEHLPDKES
jgi:asparagine N-glycosylation enzyme membrane subunit Stt3